MPKKLNKAPSFFKNMSTLKKVLIAFFVLLIFIIIVEQPGSDENKRKKHYKFFVPKLIIEDVEKIQIKNINKINIVLEKNNGEWYLKDKTIVPGDKKKILSFLKNIHNLKEGELVSKNLDRISIYNVDKNNGAHVQIWDNKKHEVTNFFAGKYSDKGQFIRRSDSNRVFNSDTILMPFLKGDVEGWKNKTVLAVDEKKAMKITLKSLKKELVLAKSVTRNQYTIDKSPEKASMDDWIIANSSNKYEASEQDLKDLFDQLKQLKAQSFADNEEGKLVDFQEPDYKITARMVDNSIKSAVFKASKIKKDKYFAKNQDGQFIYILSSDFVDKIFGLKFEDGKK